QKKANLHFSLTLDLFGSEISTNAANAFNASLKGRYVEDQIDDDHLLLDATYPVVRLKNGHIVEKKVPALSALNMRLRDDYITDAASGTEPGGFASWIAPPRTGIDGQPGNFEYVKLAAG